MSQLSAALKALRKQKLTLTKELSRLDVAIAALTKVNGTGGHTAQGARRDLSVAARRRIAQAQKARWAAWRAKQKKAA